MTEKSGFDLILVGLGVMGSSFVRNLARNNYKIAAFDINKAAVDRFREENSNPNIQCFHDITEAIECLSRPRKALLLISPGAPVDLCLESLLKTFEAGDIIVDFGNSNFRDTERRQEICTARNIHFLGIGVSGGKEGALNGPSLMPGGDKSAMDTIMPLLRSVAAKIDATPCVRALGPGGAGHFVKTVHNGIEYGLMQVIAECYDLFRKINLSAAQIADIFEKWISQGLGSFLMEVTVRCLREIEPSSGKYLVDCISDRAEQKGTGKWTIIEALNLGVACNALAAAVDARNVSANVQERESLAVFRDKVENLKDISTEDLISACRDSLQFAFLICYCQGFSIIKSASDQFQWSLNLPDIAFVWKAGCIIRSDMLNDIEIALEDPKARNFLLASEILHNTICGDARSLRKVLNQTMHLEVPTPVLAACLSYFDSLRAERLPQNLIQAQRDAFGGHKFRLINDGNNWLSWDWKK